MSEQYIFEDCGRTVVKFGYGAIRGQMDMNLFTLREIVPPLEAGAQLWEQDNKGELTKLGEWEDTDRSVSIHFRNLADVAELDAWIDLVEDRECAGFEWRGIVFDFSKYHESAVELLRLGTKAARRYLFSLMAC